MLNERSEGQLRPGKNPLGVLNKSLVLVQRRNLQKLGVILGNTCVSGGHVVVVASLQDFISIAVADT